MKMEPKISIIHMALQIKYEIINFIVFAGCIYFFIFVYDLFSRLFKEYGGRFIWHIITKSKTEYLIILSLLIFMYFNFKNNLILYISTLYIVVGLYISFDIFHHYFRRSPKLRDIKTLKELYITVPIYTISVLLYIMSFVLAIIIVWVDALIEFSPDFVILSLSIKFSSIYMIYYVISKYVLNEDIFKNRNYFSVVKLKSTVKKVGRIFTFILYSYRDHIVRQKFINESYTIDINKYIFKYDIFNKVNVHLIMLESFIDPRLLSGISCNRSPLSDEMYDVFNRIMAPNDMFSIALSPTYGGNTTQSIFEILTGVEALGLIDPIDFNVFDSGKVQSFPASLGDEYVTIATHAYDSSCFNERRAYKALQIHGHHYLAEGDGGFIPEKGDEVVFDGTLLDHHLRRIESALLDNSQCLFTFAEGMYGHVPYKRNIISRPDVIFPDKGGAISRNIFNIFYYRTKSLAKFINSILDIDPDSIIFIFSDHLPPILGSKFKYKYSEFENSVLLINKGKFVDVTGMRYYEIPWKIRDYLTNKPYKRIITDNDMKKLYFSVLHQSM